MASVQNRYLPESIDQNAYKVRRAYLFGVTMSFDKSTIDAISKVLKADEFDVRVNPTILGGSSLPVTPDIIASKNDTLLVIEVKSSKRKKIHPAEVAQSINYANRILQDKERLPPGRISPYLVLVNTTASASLRNFCEENRINISEVSWDTIEHARHTDDANELAGIKQLIFEQG